MKVVQLIARVNQGGTANWLRMLVSQLRENGDNVELLAGFTPDSESEDRSFSDLDGIRISTLGRKISLLSDLRAIIEVRKIIRKESPDILNTHTAKAGLIGRVAAIGLNCKVVHTYHGHLLYGYFSPGKTKILKFIEKFMTNLTDAYIFVGEKVRLELLAEGIGKGKPYKVILPAIEISEFSETFQLRKSYLASDHNFTVGWLGRITSIKRLDRVLELAKKLPDIQFIVGGEGDIPLDERYINQENIKFLGWVSPTTFWNRCDLGILTSDNEGIPTSLIEAAVSGLPVVSYNVGSVSEVILDNQTGYLVSELSQMETKIIEIKNDKDKLSEIGHTARAIGLEKFNKKHFMQAHLDLYKSLLID